MNRFSKKNYNYKKNRKKNTKNIRSKKNKRKFTKRKQCGGGLKKPGRQVSNTGTKPAKQSSLTKRILRRASSTLSLSGRSNTQQRINILKNLPPFDVKYGVKNRQNVEQIIINRLNLKKNKSRPAKQIADTADPALRKILMEKYIEIIKAYDRGNPKFKPKGLSELVKIKEGFEGALKMYLKSENYPLLSPNRIEVIQAFIDKQGKENKIEAFEKFKKMYEAIAIKAQEERLRKMEANLPIKKAEENRRIRKALSSDVPTLQDTTSIKKFLKHQIDKGLTTNKILQKYYNKASLLPRKDVMREDGIRYLIKKILNESESEYSDPKFAKSGNGSENEYSYPKLATQNRHNGTYDYDAKAYEYKLRQGSVSSDTSGYSSGSEYGGDTYGSAQRKGSVNSGTSDISGSSGYSSESGYGSGTGAPGHEYYGL